jgi:hypothetical protein
MVTAEKSPFTPRITTFSGLVGAYVTVPNMLDMLDMLDWACLAPRLQSRPTEPRNAAGYEAPPAAASALSTPPIYATGFLELYTN